MMKMFVFTLKDYALEWFDDCSPKEISSFSSLIKTFHEFWDPSYEDEAQVDNLDAHVVLNVCHEKNKEIQDLMFLMHSSPSKALVAEIEENIKVLNTLFVFLEGEGHGSTIE
jgi:hypothetical protein